MSAGLIGLSCGKAFSKAARKGKKGSPNILFSSIASVTSFPASSDYFLIIDLLPDSATGFQQASRP